MTLGPKPKVAADAPAGPPMDPGCPEAIRALDLGRPALLEASAGTGKTYAIEHLVLRLLTERDERDLDLEGILVLTFTKKATGELKEKIRNRLAERLKAPDLPPALRGRLRDAWLNFDRASVFTIHGFCERVLRNYAFENRALFAHDRADDKQILETVLTEEMRSTWLSPDSPGGEGEEGFRRLAARLGLSPSGEWREKILGLARAYNPYRGDRLLPVIDPERARTLEGEARAALEALLAAAGDFPAGAETQHPGYQAAKAGSYSPASRKKPALDLIEALLALARTARAEPAEGRMALLDAFLKAHARKAAVTEGFDRLLPGDGPAQGGLTALRALAGAMDRFRRASEGLRDEAAKRDFEAERKVIEAVQREARDYKRRRGILGFDDMIENLCEAVEGPDLVRVLRQRYRVCIVDEFQDTDPLQWRIFRKVFLESGSNPLWLIGDPKQAIYGFRGGDIHTYLEARQDLYALSRDGRAAGLSLGANFRSSAAMIAACNAIFDHKDWFRIREPAPGDEAWRLAPQGDPLGYLPVVPGGRQAQECREAPGPDGSSPAPVVLRDFAHIPTKKAAQREVNRWVAGEILDLMAEPGRLQVPEAGGWRPLDWGDICVLTRTNPEIRLLEAEFRRRGIPFQIHKRTGLWQSEAATEFLALLESLEDPRDHGRHARALLTHFFRTPGSAALGAPPAEVHPAFEGWLELAARRRWQRLFHELLYGTGLLYRECLDGDGDRRVMDFLHVGQNLVQEALRENLSLAALAQRLRDLRLETPDAEDERHLHREDSESRKVAVMTYHISKGLEFPVVFLAGMAGTLGDAVHRYREGGHTVFHLDKGDAGAREAARLEADQEERRLFYVALTRAKFKLYLPLPAPLFKPRTACPLGGFVADAVRAAQARHPGLFHSRTDAGPADAKPVDAARTAALGAIPSDPDGPPSAREIGEDFPGGFPRDNALSGSAADFSRRRRPLASYSNLVSRGTLAAEGLEGRYEKDEVPPEPDPAGGDGDEAEHYASAPPPTSMDMAAIPGNALPRGREVGNMFHEILENVDFARVGEAGSSQALLDHVPTRDVILARLEEHRVEATHLGDVTQVIWNVLRAPIPDCAAEAGAEGRAGQGGGTFRFADLTARRHEMEFLFPYPPHPPRSPEGGGGEGYLWGYIDLVFRREGRYYLLDWKSNWLEDYGPASLRRDVAESRYDLQYMLYSMALDRWLGTLIPGYDPARHFGGVYYVYLRGLDAAAAPGSAGPGAVPGVFAARPSPDQLAREFPAHLDRALGRRPA